MNLNYGFLIPYICLCCSVIGGTVIAMGLYLVVWGKGKDYEVSGLAILEKNGLQELPIRNKADDDYKLDSFVADGSNLTIPAGGHRQIS